MKVRYLLLAAVSVFALAGGGQLAYADQAAGAGAAAVSAANGASGVTTHAVAGSAASRAAAVTQYWTPERMRNAIPAQAPADAKPLSQPAATLSTLKLTTLTSAQSPSTGRTHPAPAALTAPATQGKVFFHNPVDGKDYVCSGGVINNPTKDMVFTAGHCVHQGSSSSWMTNWAFVPAYYNGSEPYGIWYANKLTTFNAWISSSDLNYDIGVVNVGSNGGNLLVNMVGGNGLQYNYGYSVTVTIWGYPAELGYNGQVPYYCYNLTTWQDGSRVRSGCSMVGGASGGPWLKDYNTSNGLGNENGVTSTRTVPPGYIDSPYFDNKIGTIYGNTANL